MSEGIVSVTNTALTDVIGDVENISRDLVSANQTALIWPPCKKTSPQINKRSLPRETLQPSTA